MSYTYDRYDRDTGELHTIVETGEPCLCFGDDLPHPPGWPGCARTAEPERRAA